MIREVNIQSNCYLFCNTNNKDQREAGDFMIRGIPKKLEKLVGNVPFVRIGSFLIPVISLIIMFRTPSLVWGMIFFFFLGLFFLVEGIHPSGTWRAWKYIIQYIVPSKIQNIILITLRFSLIVIGAYFILLVSVPVLRNFFEMLLRSLGNR